MKIKQKISKMKLVVFMGFFAFTAATPFAMSGVVSALECGSVTTSIISCDGDDGRSGLEGSGLWSLLLMTINILTAGVGVLALAGIVYGAVLYTSAGGNPEQVKKAKGIFMNVVIGVIAFAGMYALLNFIIPGGVLNI